jgi:CelD/BcsL family acetyltransferase involved in cellulose biosynthesis
MVFRNEGKVAGVMPLFLHEWHGRRQLTLIGAGISDYLDPLFQPDCTDEIVQRIASELHGWTDWDCCDWQDLSRDTPLAGLGVAAPDTPCSSITMEASYAEFLAKRPKDLRRNLRRYKEKAQAIAPVTFQVADSADEFLMCSLIALHRERWNSAGEPGMIDANGSESFLRAMAVAFAGRGWLRIFTVRFGDSIAAVLLAFCDRTNIFSWLSAFDPKYEEFGFGRELLARAIGYAHARGCRNWNFLRGAEPYKFSWGARPVPKCRVLISR